MRAVVLGVLLVAACGGSARVTKVGRDMWAVECGRRQARCWEAAGSVCPDGWETVDGSRREGTAVTAGGGVLVAQPTYEGDMLIRCQGPKATLGADAPPRYADQTDDEFR